MTPSAAMSGNPLASTGTSETHENPQGATSTSPAKSQLSMLVNLLFSEEADDGPRAAGTIIGLTSPIHGEGTSTISALLAMELGRSDRSHTLLITSSELARLRPEDLVRFEDLWMKNRAYGYWQTSSFLDDDQNGHSPWNTDLGFRRTVIDRLRRRFHNVLIDCQPVRESSDVAAVASLIDGFILVIRSGSSTREQVQETIRVVQLTSGVIKGCCFNRRTYPIPERLYNWIKR